MHGLRQKIRPKVNVYHLSPVITSYGAQNADLSFQITINYQTELALHRPERRVTMSRK